MQGIFKILLLAFGLTLADDRAHHRVLEFGKPHMAARRQLRVVRRMSADTTNTNGYGSNYSSGGYGSNYSYGGTASNYGYGGYGSNYSYNYSYNYSNNYSYGGEASKYGYGGYDIKYSYNYGYGDTGSKYGYGGFGSNYSYNYSYGGTGSKYGYGGYASKYGYGGYGHNYSYGGNASKYGYGGWGGYSFLECPEMYCYPMVYSDDGEIDWDATYQVFNYTCATYDEGCPCNQQWEVECESYGYKTCTPKSEGCYDPFDVDCDEETEEVCKDEWSAYCWDKSWGSCPVTCTYEEIYCYSYAYDSEGNVDWEAQSNQFCANATTGCPCDEKWEEKCTDSWGYSWCTPKTYPCPLECGVEEQVCHQLTYLSTGEPDWSVPGVQSCHPWNSTCPCVPEYEELCTTSWGSYCQSTHGGQSCPLSCKEDEHYCYAIPYDASGFIDYEAEWEESCAPVDEGCPCNAEWEHKCTSEGYSWCESKEYSCPLDCGGATECWHHSGNMSCGTSDGCTCESDELACEDSAGMTECYAKEWYGDACPLVCNYETQNWCYLVGFDSDGFMTWTEYCYTKTDPEDWYCPVICNNDTAKKCGEGDFAECVPVTEECPEVCTSEQQMCWMDNYDTTGNYVSGVDKCAPQGEDCPCGDNTVKCTFDGWSYCEAAYYGCPITCGADEKYCYPVSFTPEGDYDWESPVQEVCANVSETCPCGANAKPCKWTDEWGYEQDWCFPENQACPVTCSEGQQRCYITDFNASGYPETYSERCMDETRSCPCGTNSQECYDPYWDESYCYPLADFWLKEPMNCPVYCTDDEDYCYIPSYDTKGNWIRTTEECVPKGQACDCSKGQNAFSCTFNDEFWGSWTECLPTHNGYCPTDCADGEVACDLVEDYMPNGTSLGLVQPSVKCAASHDQCPCGKEASRCPNEGCIFKDEGCAVECGADEKKCYLADYTADGSFISDQEVCVPKDDTCPCGKNTAKCADSDLCVRASEKDLVCPCKASEKECRVTDYTKDGTVAGYSTQCVKEGTACPCGQNTISCPDPNDVLQSLCTPSFQHKRCPAPCTAEAILAGNTTCVLTNLDADGNFKSETITCIGPNATCGVGDGMKRCQSGAAIAVDTTCRNLYAATGSARRLSAARQLSGTAERETCEAIVTMSSLRSDAASKAETVRVKMNSVLQIPSTLKTTLLIKSTATSRRLDGRKLSSTVSTMIFFIDNQGVSASVTPGQVCEELKKMVKASSPSLTSAVSPAGVIDAKAGVNLEISTATLQSRDSLADDQLKEKAGVTTRSTTTTTTTTTSGTSSTEAGDSSSSSSSSSSQSSTSSDSSTTSAAGEETDFSSGRSTMVLPGAALAMMVTLGVLLQS